MDPKRIFNVFRRYLWIFILAILVASFTTFFLLDSQPTIFEAKTRLLVGPSVDCPSPDLNSLKIGGQLIQTYAELVSTKPFLNSVNEKTNQTIDLDLLSGLIETRQNTDTRILTIVVHHSDRNQAVAIANAITDTLIEMSPSKDNTTTLLREQMSNQSHQLEKIINDSEASIQNLEIVLVELGNAHGQDPKEAQAILDQQNLTIKQLSEERARLSDALRTLTTVYQVLLDTNTNQLEIIEPAEKAYPVTQRRSLTMALSGLAGLILATIVVFGLDYFDDRIRNPEEMTKVFDSPLLGTIVRYKRLDGSRLKRIITFSQPGTQVANVYRTVAAKLILSYNDSSPCSILVSNLGPNPESDTVLTLVNLGIAFSQAGKRVVLVDAQFNNPGLTELFESVDSEGLVDYLANTSSKLKLISVNEAPGVQVLPVGKLSKSGAGVMVNTSNIIKLLKELQKETDIILVAGSSILMFAESLAFTSHVDGTILVVAHGEARKKIVHDTLDLFRDMKAKLIGTIYDYNVSQDVQKIDIKIISKGKSKLAKNSLLDNS